MTTAAEAIREVRELLAGELCRPVVDRATVKGMLWTVHYIAEDGYVNSINEIRLRRYRRRSAVREEHGF
jgi:hypothetical protein